LKLCFGHKAYRSTGNTNRAKEKQHKLAGFLGQRQNTIYYNEERKKIKCHQFSMNKIKAYAISNKDKD